MHAGIHLLSHVVSDDAIDGNGHVNNVEYVAWMQQAAISHAQTAGAASSSQALGATWVVRSHHIEYLRPAFAGDSVTVHTWVARIHRASSIRKYLFTRTADAQQLARAETLWVFVDARSGRPRPIPASILSAFCPVPAGEEP